MNRFQVDPIKTNEFRNYYKAGDQILTWNEEDKDIHNLGNLNKMYALKRL